MGWGRVLASKVLVAGARAGVAARAGSQCAARTQAAALGCLRGGAPISPLRRGGPCRVLLLPLLRLRRWQAACLGASRVASWRQVGARQVSARQLLTGLLTGLRSGSPWPP